jgi:hypothetical protein
MVYFGENVEDIIALQKVKAVRVHIQAILDFYTTSNYE